MVTLQIIGPAFPDSFSASLLTALIYRSLFMPPISLPSFSINLSLPLSRKQRKSSDRMRSEEGTGHSSPRRTLGTRRVHTCETLFCSSRPQFVSDSETKRPSRGGLGLRFKESVRWRRGKRSRASHRNERSRRVLPRRSAFSATPHASRM